MILAILQARMSSSRLPGKVLKPILGKPMLQLHIERVQSAKFIDKLVIATSTSADDNAIEQLCKELNVECYRGSLDDVLDRFAQAAAQYQPDYVLRLTGDCPLFDPSLCDEFIHYALTQNYDYCTNSEPATFPDGLDMEIMTYQALLEAAENAKLSSEREHVTPYIQKHAERFKVGSFKNDIDQSALRWTVDEPEDFVLVTEIYNALYPTNQNFTWIDVLHYVNDHPELSTLNRGIDRNEGYKRSLEKDVYYESIRRSG